LSTIFRVSKDLASSSLLADQERVLGRDHPGTPTTRNNLANAYRVVGRIE
jgi:hypothetical protein